MGRPVKGAVAGAAAVAVLALAGCSDKQGPTVDDPVESSSSEPTAPSSSAAAEPEPWEEKSKAGAVAFSKHWVELFNEAITSGETEALTKASDPSCVSCQDIVDRVVRTYADDGFFETQGWEVMQATARVEGPGAELGLRIMRSEQRYRDSADAPISTDPASKATYKAELLWTGDAWVMKSLALFA